MQLSVVIVSYNVKYFLEQCLASLRLSLQGLQAEIWVVDNNSADGSVAYLQPMFPDVNFVALAQNIGFASANNSVLSSVKGDLILFLNPDTLVSPESLAGPVAYFQQHASVGALGIGMIDGSGTYLPESKRGFPSPATSLYKQLGLYKLFPTSARFARYYMGHLPAHNTAEVEVLAGAFMMVRQSILQTVGGFDEQFFMYGEDIDLSYRITQAGYHNVYFAASRIVHFKGESTAKQSLQYVRVFYDAMQRFVKKHFSGSGAGWFRLLLFAGIGMRAAASAVRRLFTTAPAVPMWPSSIAFFAIGWPLQIPRPNAMKVENQVIHIHWQEEMSAGHCDVLLVVGVSMGMNDAINYLQQHGTTHNCWLHIAKTNSLVMSNNKNKAGVTAVFVNAE